MNVTASGTRQPDAMAFAMAFHIDSLCDATLVVPLQACTMASNEAEYVGWIKIPVLFKAFRER